MSRSPSIASWSTVGIGLANLYLISTWWSERKTWIEQQEKIYDQVVGRSEKTSKEIREQQDAQWKDIHDHFDRIYADDRALRERMRAGMETLEKAIGRAEKDVGLAGNEQVKAAFRGVKDGGR